MGRLNTHQIRVVEVEAIRPDPSLSWQEPAPDDAPLSDWQDADQVPAATAGAPENTDVAASAGATPTTSEE